MCTCLVVKFYRMTMESIRHRLDGWAYILWLAHVDMFQLAIQSQLTLPRIAGPALLETQLMSFAL